MSIDEDKQADTPAVLAEELHQAVLNPKEGEEPEVEIPDTKATRLAQAALEKAPSGSTIQQLEALIGKTATVTTKVRKAMAEREFNRRVVRGEDKAQEQMTGKPIPFGQDWESLLAGATAVLTGDSPYMHIPAESHVQVPAGIRTGQYKMTEVKGAQDSAFNGRYYHAKKVKSNQVEKAATGPEPQKALDALFQPHIPSVEAQSEEIEKMKPIARNTLRQRVPQLLALLVVAAGIALWLYHSHQAKRRAAETVESAAAASEQQARSIVARVRNSWNADDDWEDTFSSKGAYFTPYTIELENELLKVPTVVAFGLVGDVRKSGQQDNSIVLIQDIGRTMKWDLRFSLLSAPATTRAILNGGDRRYETFVIAATITSVEKVSMTPDKSDNDQDYFLAHGILHEAQPIGSWERPPHK
jgi:hypothetical protein